VIIGSVQLIGALLIACIAHMTFYEQKYGNMMADDFMFNWSKKPIVDIVAVDDHVCPHGFTPLIEDSW
jgi:hypothetical protein